MASIGSPVLFAPASGPTGSGEYYRCLHIARAIQTRQADRPIHVLLHRDAEVERDPAFTYHGLDDTPAKQRKPVARLIDEIKPALAVFDSTGRQMQFKAVKRNGGRLAWISNRPDKRLKAFRLQTLRLLDLHLILDSDRVKPRLSSIERWLLKLYPRVQVEFITAIAPEAALPAIQADGSPEPQALFVSGGGGYVHRGQPVPDIFLKAAIQFQAATGRSTAVVMGPQYRGAIRDHDKVQVIPTVSSVELSRLFQTARIAVIGAGNMLTGQALTADNPACVLCAVGGQDQPTRVRQYADQQAVLVAELDANDLCKKACMLVDQPALAKSIKDHARAMGLKNDTAAVAEHLLRLID